MPAEVSDPVWLWTVIDLATKLVPRARVRAVRGDCGRLLAADPGSALAALASLALDRDRTTIALVAGGPVTESTPRRVLSNSINQLTALEEATSPPEPMGARTAPHQVARFFASSTWLGGQGKRRPGAEACPGGATNGSSYDSAILSSAIFKSSSMTSRWWCRPAGPSTPPPPELRNE